MDSAATIAEPLPVLPITRPISPRGWKHLHYLLLLLITIAGAIIRLTRLDQPALWGDEAATFRRVCGSYVDLISELLTDGFVPLHYSLYWWIGQHTKLTPHVMRLVPALAGVLMIPAMYFLARQIVSRRVAMLTAAFTACSAFLCVYSRDAKMYSHLWLFCVLSVACLLWWLRKHQRIAWLAWIAASLAAVGTHAPAFILLAIQPLLLLTQRRLHWKQTLAFVLGLGIICAGPAGYYLGFNKYAERLERRGWRASGITWVEDRNEGHSGPMLALDTATGFLFGWLYIQEEATEGEIPRTAMIAAVTCTTVLLSLFALGAMPWPRRWRGRPGEHDPAPPGWIGALWILVWLIVPAYAVYRASVADAVSPQNWLDALGALYSNYWWLVISQIIVLGALATIWPRIAVIFAACIVLCLIVILDIAWLQNGFNFIAAMRDAVLLLTHPIVVAAILILLPPIAWAFCGSTMLERSQRLLRFSLVAITLILLCIAISVAITDPMPGSVWMPRYLGVLWPALAIGACWLLWRLPTLPLRIVAIMFLLGINLVQVYHLIFIPTQPPVDRIARDILDANETSLTYARPGRHHGGPSGASHMTSVGRYYLLMWSGRPTRPRQFMRENVVSEFGMRLNTDPGAIAADVKKLPQVNRIVVWEPIKDSKDGEEDRLLTQLGTGWRLETEELYPVRLYFSWIEYFEYRRRIYKRQ